jgi:hypothetical protein
MKTNVTIAPTGTPFSLPMTAVFLVKKYNDKAVAHALDFDLVTVASTEEEAMRKMRIAVKHHVEFGLKNNFNLDILQSAPEEAWSALTPDATLSIGEPIEVCDRRMLTATKTTVQHEDYRSLAAA